jgi:hypothetical protein
MIATLVLLVVIFFAGMGILALAAPERITVTFGTTTLTPAGRNEVRAVYGGFGLAMAAMIFAAAREPTLARGIYLTVAAALGGMAAGRIVSAAVERPRSFYPSWLYCALETGMALTLLAAASGIAS